MSAGQNTSSGKSRALLLAGLVLVIAVVAAAVTVVVSSKTYSPGGRTVPPSLLVAAGSDHVDEEAGLVVRVPRGWTVETADLIFGSTALYPEPDEDTPVEEAGPGGIVLVGKLTPNLFASREADNQRAAASLVAGMGEFFMPIPGRRTEQRMEEVSSRVGDGWALSYRVVPEGAEGAPDAADPVSRDGGIAYSAVVGEGEDRYWVTLISSPGDGSQRSPDPEWADAIVERLRPHEGGSDETGSEEPAQDGVEQAPRGTA